MNDLKLIYHKLHLMLQYEGGGNYTKLNDIITRSGLLSINTHDYLAYNLIQAFLISGIINISWETTGMRWCYVSGGLTIPVSEKKIRKIVKEEDLLLSKQGDHGVIQDSTGIPFVFSETIINDNVISYWGSSFFERLIPFSLLVDKSHEKVGAGLLSEKQVCRFDFDLKKWRDYTTMDFSRSGLLKVMNDRFGYSFFIYEATSSTLYRIIDVEWMFITSMFILNIPFEKIFFYEHSNIEHFSLMRIPTVFSRYFFANSEQVKIGQHVQYIDVKPESVYSLRRYLLLEHST